jgi:hypothetical protein
MPLTVPRTSTDVDYANARAHLTRNKKNVKEQILPPATPTQKGSKIQPTPSHNGTIVTVKTKNKNIETTAERKRIGKQLPRRMAILNIAALLSWWRLSWNDTNRKTVWRNNRQQRLIAA